MARHPQSEPITVTRISSHDSVAQANAAVHSAAIPITTPIRTHAGMDAILRDARVHHGA